MGKRKSKKIAHITRVLITLLVLFVYFYVISLLLFASYCYFNLTEINIYFLASAIIISIIPSCIIALTTAKDYKRWFKIIDMTKGLLVSLPIIVMIMFSSSLIYKSIRTKQITEENERIFENYDKYVDFNEIEDGYSFRFDENNTVYYLEEGKLRGISPLTFYDLKNNYIFKTYKIDKGYMIETETTTYFSKTLKENALLYSIPMPKVKIKRQIEPVEYFKLDGKMFKDINKDYKSEQNHEKLFLYKKYNKILYTQEKLFDLRIQILNNFIASQEAIYEERYVIVPIGNKKYKVEFTFNNELEVIFSKEELS